MPARGRRRASAPQRKPTYGSALRIAHLLLELQSRPYGWAYDDVCEALGISRRTLARYLEVCRHDLVDETGRPRIEVIRRGDRRVLRFVERPPRVDGGPYELVALFFNLALARFLRDTVLDQGAADIVDRLRRSLRPAQRRLLEHIDRKLFALDYAPKDYRKQDELLDAVLRALLGQRRLRIDYRTIAGEQHTHPFDPYTLLGYRGGLYLLGRSHLRRKIIWLAIDRIRSAEPARDEAGAFVTFAYPSTFHPARYTDGMFGVVEGEPTDVELAIENGQTEAYLKERRIHPSQRFSRGRDGRARLHLRVRGTVELANWILSMVPYLEVIRPPELRSEIRSRLRTALARHR